MLTGILRASIALAFAVAYFFSSNGPAFAQIAPTNSATISGSVVDAAGKAAPKAQVAINGPKHAATQTDAQGQFAFVGVPFGDYQLSVTAATVTTTRNLSVQGDVNIAIQYEPASGNGLKTIANVNSSTNATFNIAPASVTQVSPVQEAFFGKTSWRTVLERIPGVAQTGVKTGTSAYAALPDGPLFPLQISINGALPYETATLLDDMPLISAVGFTSGVGSGTNLGAYPLNGFGSADIVRGPGANAPSIVDSIGGSFLLHAPSAVNHNTYTLSLSTDPYGGFIANAQAAVRLKKLSVVVTYGINNSPGPLSSAGFAAYAANGVSMVNGLPFSGGSFAGVIFVPNTTPALLGFQTNLVFGGINQSTAWSQHSGSAALIYTVSPAVTAELFYAGQASQMPGFGYYNLVNFTPPAGYTGGVPAGQNFFNVNSTGIIIPTFLQTSSLIEEKVTANLGRGSLRLAALQNRVYQKSSSPTAASSTENVQLYGSGTWNGSPAVFNGGTYNVTFNNEGGVASQGSDNRDLLLNYATPIGENFRVGMSFVKSYDDGPMNQVLYTSGVLGPVRFIPSAISQSTNELRFFAGGEPSERTSVDLSMYFANANYHVPDPYNTTINRLTYTNATYIDTSYSYAAPRLGFVWRPTASIAIRAAAGGGFAEAPLSSLIGSSGIPAYNSTLGVYSVSLTNTNVQPEKSFSFDIGTDIRLHGNTVFSFDVYRSNLYGQLYSATTQTGTFNDGTHGTLPLFTTQNGNLGKSRMEGVLLDVRHDIPHGTYWSFSGGLTRGYLVSVPGNFYGNASGPCNFSINKTPNGAACTNLTVVPNINFNGTFVGTVPYAQGLGVLGYRWNPDKYIDLVGTYYGNNNTYLRPAFIEWDAHFGYPLTKTVALRLTFQNITGIYDGTTQLVALPNISTAPTLAGLPAAVFGEEYGPRTLLLTTAMKL